MTHELILRARAGDEAALRELYEAHGTRVLRLAYALLGDADEAEDVMQDVMVQALTRLERYDPERAAFSTWLHTITVNKCRDRQRRLVTRLRGVGLWLNDQGSKGTDPEERLSGIAAAADMRVALGRLTARQREAFVLRELEGLSFQELGDALGVPMRTAQARVAAAHVALRALLAPAPPPASVPEVDHA